MIDESPGGRHHVYASTPPPTSNPDPPPPLNFHIFKLFDKKLNHFLGTSSRLNKGFTDSNVTMLTFIVNDCVFRSGSDLSIKLKIESGVCYK